MKMKCDKWRVTSDRMKGATREARSCHVSRVTCHPQKGVALIITLILLSVVTFMAITFLALSRRERSAVATVTDTASARLAADAALASAEAQVIANVLSTTNPYNFSLLVSTNYINPVGFTNGGLNDVNYYDPSGNFLTNHNFLTLLTNLWYSPRPPVFILTNATGGNDFRFYLDLNRNGRDEPNGWVAELDNSGAVIKDGFGNAITNIQVGDPEWIGVLERPDAPYGPNNKFVARFAFIALPIGNTLDLNAIHNQVFDEFNASPTVNPNSDVYFRNQGVGSWEINLAAFLADLNTDIWDKDPTLPAIYYQYNEPANYNSGFAFDDARALLAWRYANNYKSLTNANALFINGSLVFTNDNIDGYSDGQLQTTFNTNADWVADNPALPWAGADNTNHFFTHQELFDPAKTEIGVTPPSPGFIEHLLAAGNTNSTYDRYTFYRLLSQLGTDSTPESGKMNLNYDNLDLFTNGVAASTNFMAWTPLAFFTNAADRLLRAYTTQWRNSNPTNFAATFYSVTNFNSITDTSQWTNYPAFGITNIPVWVSNRFVYSSAVNRLLQLTANLYDATMNNTFAEGRNYPSVFRPLFSRNASVFGTNVFISGYTNVLSVLGTNDDRLSLPMEIADLAATNIVFTNLAVNVYGVPWIVGAKKGFPSFNKFSFESVVGITRRLQVTRNNLNGGQPSANTFFTNQMYTMSVSNYLGVEFWNSYASGYTGAVQIVTRDYLSMWLTNNYNSFRGTNFPVFASVINPAGATWGWTGYGASIASPASNSFVVPLLTNAVSLPESVYRFTLLPPFVPIGTNDISHVLYESNLITSVGSQFPFPHFGLLTTNRLQAFVLDYTNGAYRIIDHVLFQQISSRDLNAEFLTDKDDHGVWTTVTNTSLNIPMAILNQLNFSRAAIGYEYGNIPSEDGKWKSDPMAQQQSGSATIEKQQAFFDAFFKPNNRTTEPVPATNTLLSVQAPYSPTRYVVQCTFMQANDPLVHYLASDLNQFSKNKTANYPSVAPAYLTNLNGLFLNGLDFRKLNLYYRPWGGNPIYTETDDTNQWNFAIKDPRVYTSDYWDFPTDRLPTVGWLGRVHRGTPWQTVYLKSTDLLRQIQIIGTPPNATTNYVGLTNWMNWTGDMNSYGYDANNSAPVQDRLLFDLFTTAFNDNATRGTLSVNVGPTNANLAAWSALFSGIVVPTNLVGGYTIINPAGSASAPVPVGPPPSPNSPLCLGYLVQNGTNGINDIRANTNLFPLQSFTHVGDILAVPALTEKSPFLAGLDPNKQISDEMYEWLPQQTMSLLRCSSSPRYVIYCYGQALKPAPNGIYTGNTPPGTFGLVTNYQVVSEIATRAVVRFGSSLTNVITGTNVVVAGITNWNWFSIPVVTNNNAVIEQFNILPPD